MNRTNKIFWNCVTCGDEYYSTWFGKTTYFQHGAMADVTQIVDGKAVDPMCDHCKPKCPTPNALHYCAHGGI